MTRWVFAGAGSLIVLVTVAWMTATVLTPVQVNPDTAISSYAKGYGQAWRGNPKDAIASFDEALKLAPNYANAAYERGNAHFSLASDTIGTDPSAAQEELRLAAADFETARKAGKDDGSVNWNLGWDYYLLGFYGESATASRRALEGPVFYFRFHFVFGLGFRSNRVKGRELVSNSVIFSRK